MRPVDKWAAGQPNPNGTRVSATYTPYGTALEVLLSNLGSFCSYCEVFSSDLEVEHIISQNQNPALSTQWDNFLLACGRCNGRDNKTNKPVDMDVLYLPHRNNTLLAFEYLPGGVVRTSTALTVSQRAKAEATIDLLGLDKYPGNPKYPPNNTHAQGFPNGDRRWQHRLERWILAQQKLADYTAGNITAQEVADFALQRGFFSIWFAVFNAHIPVKQALVQTFLGTATACFDAQANPIARNVGNAIDTL